MPNVYFSHDVDAMSDPKIESLILERGMAGYGAYWAIVEMMRRAEDDGYRLRVGNVTVRAIAARCRITKDEAEGLLAELIEEHELFVEDGEWIFSESLLRRMEIKDAKKEERAESGRKGAEKRWHKPEPRKRKAQPSPNDAQPDVEDSSAIAADSLAIDSHRLPNAKNGKEKVKAKYNLPSGGANADASPPVEAGEHSSLHKTIMDSYLARAPDRKFENRSAYQREAEAAKRMIELAGERSPDDPRDFVRRMVQTHRALKDDPKSLLHDQPFRPSLAMSGGLLPRILERMDRREQVSEVDQAALEGAMRRLSAAGVSA